MLPTLGRQHPCTQPAGLHPHVLPTSASSLLASRLLRAAASFSSRCSCAAVAAASARSLRRAASASSPATSPGPTLRRARPARWPWLPVRGTAPKAAACRSRRELRSFTAAVRCAMAAPSPAANCSGPASGLPASGEAPAAAAAAMGVPSFSRSPLGGVAKDRAAGPAGEAAAPRPSAASPAASGEGSSACCVVAVAPAAATLPKKAMPAWG